MRDLFGRKPPGMEKSVDQLTEELIDVNKAVEACLREIKELESLQRTTVSAPRPIDGLASGQVFELPSSLRGADRIDAIRRIAEENAERVNADAKRRFEESVALREADLPSVPARLEKLGIELNRLREEQKRILEQRRKA